MQVITGRGGGLYVKMGVGAWMHGCIAYMCLRESIAREGAEEDFGAAEGRDRTN